jgi:hypothetical protein
MGRSVNQTVETLARFVEAGAVIDKNENVEFRRPGQGDAMFFDVDGILGGIELDVHDLFVTTGESPRQSCRWAAGLYLHDLEPNGLVGNGAMGFRPMAGAMTASIQAKASSTIAPSMAR